MNLKNDCQSLANKIQKLYGYKVYQQVEKNCIDTGYQTIFIYQITKKQYRNNKKGSHWKPINSSLLFLSCEINPNGITGPGDVGKTYTINISSYNNQGIGCYMFARNQKDILKQFKNWKETEEKEWIQNHQFRD